jgi:hypothetical protein
VGFLRPGDDVEEVALEPCQVVHESDIYLFVISNKITSELHAGHLPSLLAGAVKCDFVPSS